MSDSINSAEAISRHPMERIVPRHDRASELLDEWDCLDELVDEEAWSQELVV